MPTVNVNFGGVTNEEKHYTQRSGVFGGYAQSNMSSANPSFKGTLGNSLRSGAFTMQRNPDLQ